MNSTNNLQIIKKSSRSQDNTKKDINLICMSIGTTNLMEPLPPIKHPN